MWLDPFEFQWHLPDTNNSEYLFKFTTWISEPWSKDISLDGFPLKLLNIVCLERVLFFDVVSSGLRGHVRCR